MDPSLPVGFEPFLGVRQGDEVPTERDDSERVVVQPPARESGGLRDDRFCGASTKASEWYWFEIRFRIADMRMSQVSVAANMRSEIHSRLDEPSDWICPKIDEVFQQWHATWTPQTSMCIRSSIVPVLGHRSTVTIPQISRPTWSWCIDIRDFGRYVTPFNCSPRERRASLRCRMPVSKRH